MPGDPSTSSPAPSGSADSPSLLMAKVASGSSVRTLLGLVVLWACLFMVFMAHHLSESYLRVDSTVEIGPVTSEPALYTLNPRQKLIYPFSMYARGTTVRETLANIAEYVGFSLDEPSLELLGDHEMTETIRFNKEPLFSVLNDLLGKSSLGFALQGRSLKIIEQRLDEDASPVGHEMDWSTQLPLSHQTILFMPSGKNDLFFSVTLNGNPTDPTSAQQWVYLQVWRGAEQLTMSRTILDENGNARLSRHSGLEAMAFSIERRQAAVGNEPGHYALAFYYRSTD